MSSRIIIPLPGGREVSFKVRPPDDTTALCAAPDCGKSLLRRNAFRVTATTTARGSDDVIEAKECYACDATCAAGIYSETPAR